MAESGAPLGRRFAKLRRTFAAGRIHRVNDPGIPAGRRASLAPPSFAASGSASARRALLERFKRLWWLKAVGTTAFMWFFFVLYFHLQRSPQFPVTEVPATWIDAAIPMQAWGWIPYLSLWLYASLPPAFQPNFRSLVYYGVCIGAVCGAGLLCFYYWPTSAAPVYKPPAASLSWLKGIDFASNACPSLHVASAIFSWAWLLHQLREVGAGRRWQVLNALWAVTIMYSTLVTKQHAMWDVAAGLALGGAGAVASMYVLRSARPFLYPTSPDRASG